MCSVASICVCCCAGLIPGCAAVHIAWLMDMCHVRELFFLSRYAHSLEGSGAMHTSSWRACGYPVWQVSLLSCWKLFHLSDVAAKDG